MNCEEVLLAKMAELDGESIEVSMEAANAHIEGCENCRREIAGMRQMNEMFDSYERVEADVSLWPVVRGRIQDSSRSAGWITFAVFAIALVAFKIVGMSSDNDVAWLLGVVPVVLAALLFALLRENPFKVNTELMLESDHG